MGRLITKASNIRRRLGGSGDLIGVPFPSKPKNMHWKTYWKLRIESENARTYSLMIAAKRVGIKLDEEETV
ncbi:MAG: hypothetical protein JXO48_02565 [Deltaproteobacteria bacterium]|nr:hypothetical protein [Deltaproteobacteria bacterium]